MSANRTQNERLKALLVNRLWSKNHLHYSPDRKIQYKSGPQRIITPKAESRIIDGKEC